MEMMMAMALALAAATPDCAAVPVELRAGGVCVDGPGGIAIAADEPAARALLAQAAVGAARFRAAFGREPARYAIFLYDSPAGGHATRQALRGLGFVALLPMPSATLLAGRPPGGGTAGPSAGGGTGEPRGANFVAHELGHGWYTAAFWADVPAPAGTMRYGSAAPDWLDEAAAMLMEDEDGARDYRQRFGDGRDPAHAGSTLPELSLAELTTMTHPAMAALVGRPAGAGPMVRVTSAPTLFYAQSRVFADYLIERSGDRRILAAVSQGLKARGGFDAWLAGDGARHRLAGSLAAMQQDWNAWLDKRFGPAG